MQKTQLRKTSGLGAALLYGGVFATGMALGAFSLVTPTTEVDAGEANFVRSASHDAIAGVRLDEEVVIRFKSAVLKSSVGPDTLLVRTGTNNGEQARGAYIVGKFMYDRATQQRVVVRPEAIQEWYQLVRGLSRTDAARLAARTIKRIERTGKFRKLAKIDRELRNQFFGPSNGAGTRLDDANVTGIFPPQLNDGDDLEPYRQRIAGDDVLYQDYLVGGDLTAFPALQQNSESERFFHPVDPGTGVPATRSVLRDRTYRQVLIDRRNGRNALFVPDIPIRPDLTDAGLQPGKAYSIVIPSAQPGVFNTVLTKKGRRPLLQEAGRDFSTLFTTVPLIGSGTNLFQGTDARSGIAELQKPRIINITPPNGEAFVDSTTDWEDPDNQFEVPLPARRTFTVRIRFPHALDPRTVNTDSFKVFKTKTQPGTGSERTLDPAIEVPAGVFLNQQRLGIVEVELTPAQNLDPESEYAVTVAGNVRTLGSVNGALSTLGTEFRSTFIVGPGPIPEDGIRETFAGVGNRADPNNADTIDQATTALWPAPVLFDSEISGKLAANFMPFVGFGVGAQRDPLNPVTFNPNDPDTFPVQNLALGAGETITFVSEGLDPQDLTTFGKQIEYEYQSVAFNAATADVVGRFPLVVRSQQGISLTTSAIFANGDEGQVGKANVDLINGGPVGGLGGRPGPGGFRGGDGAGAPLTDQNGDVILDGLNQLQLDPAKFDGLTGAPGHFAGALSPGGGGTGGFSGNQEFLPRFTDPNDSTIVLPEATAEAIREAGGGGGHAVAGTNGSGGGGSGKVNAEGQAGGIGGPVFGIGDMSDQPLNVNGVPTLQTNAGGGGGGGGGAEDDADSGGIEGTMGPEDAGGGGGGGGGGGIQLVARTEILLDSSILDCSGGVGGRTFDAALSDVGEGAPGGSGAGGTIWMQCFGDITIQNGSTVTVAGGIGDQTTNIGQISPDPPDTGTIKGLGGFGGNGYLRFESATGAAVIIGSTVTGSLSQAAFRPDANGDYPAHPGAPMVVNTSIAYSRWFNSQLDTPSFVAVFDDLLTPEVDGTSIFQPAGHVVDVQVRSAPQNINAVGRPDLGLVTGWVPLASANTISDRRFLQFRIDFVMPLSFTFDQARPTVEFIEISIELN